MTEPTFFPTRRELTVGEIATLTGAELRPGGDRDRRICNIAPLDHAGPSDLTFLDNARYIRHLESTRAGACLLAPRFADQAPPHVVALSTEKPYQAFVAVARALFPDALRPSSMFAPGSAAVGAFVHPAARLEAGAAIEPGAVVGAGAEIGAGTVIGPGASIGAGVRIGRDCSIGANVSLMYALLGDRVIIHPGCSIGQDGFGFVMGASGHLKVPQVGRVIIQDDVEIGAGTTIDRGAVRDTIIGEGTKIDNLVQVGHNVTIGRHCVIVAQTGISGSATLEDFVALGARVGLSNHVTIGEGAQIAALSIVNGDVPAGERWGGTPAKPMQTWFREMFVLDRLIAKHSAARAGGGDKNESGGE
jgi:UDP-3-O-[3-hydroxymyristoyl] glucosamine N-acyltransferase